MIYINDNNIFVRCNESCTVSNIPNDTGYLPLRAYNNILLMSDGKLYVITCDNKLVVLKLNQVDDYVVDPTDFTDKFVKINSKYYEIYLTSLWKIPVIANNSHNIKRILCVHPCLDYYYYYVNIKNELIVSSTPNQYIILDDNVSSILYFHTYARVIYIVYMKNNEMIYSTINNFTQLINSYIIDYTGPSIIKSSDVFLLDSHDNLYELIIMGYLKCVIKKISSDIVDFYCDEYYAYIINTKNKICYISKCNYNRIYIDAGHFGKSSCNTKSANNINKI
jgi:hypothetical protein